MEAERSIVLQKKTILFLSLIIGILFSVTYGREIKVNKNENDINTLNVVATNLSENKNEILTKNVKYLSAKVIAEESITEFSNKGIEAFAGDVISLVDEKENVANNETTNYITDTENVKEVVNDVQEVEDEKAIENAVTDVESEIVEQSEVITKEEEKTNEEKQKTVKYRELAEDNPPTEYVKVVEAKATAYCLCKKCCGKTPDHPYYGYTNSGIKIEPGTGMKVIAVDPKVIPLNSKVYVEGLNGAWDYGYAIAADTGSAIKNLKIDLYMDTHEEALQWGRKKVKVYVLGE